MTMRAQELKKMPLFWDLQRKKEWRPLRNSTGLRSRTVGIVGLGNIGCEIARLAKSFGMKVN